jgi:hypothetical protein
MDRVERELVLIVMAVLLLVGLAWSRTRYRRAYEEHYGIERSAGWLWSRDPDPRIERLRYIHIAILVGTLVVLIFMLQTLLGPR